MNEHRCAERFRLDPYVDGALDAVQTLETEAHLEGCASCCESALFLRSLKVAVKKSAEIEVPADFAERMMATARGRVQAPIPAAASALASANEMRVLEAPSTPSWRRFGAAGGAGLALAGVLAVAASVVLAVNVRRAESERVTAMQTLGEFMAEHQSPLPVDTERVHELERYVGIPVHAPSMHAIPRVLRMRLMGGRVLPVMASRAAMLQYQVDRAELGSGETEATRVPGRVSVFIYDPAKIRVDDAAFEDRRVGDSRVRVGRASGYSVAVTQRAGVGYAVATDLGPEDTAQMAGQFE